MVTSVDHVDENSEIFSALLELGTLEVVPNVLIEQHPGVAEILRKFSRVETAACFGSLLLDDRLQSNCVRLEALVHLAISLGSGSKLPTQGDLANCFNQLNDGICGQVEDPAEDVFVSMVSTSQGNFRVLEGIWECGTFYLQRIVDVVESMPTEGPFELLRNGVFALLRLSEAVCSRCGLIRHSVGAKTPRSTVPKSYCYKSKRQEVVFSEEDLAALNTSKEELDIFTFEDDLLDGLFDAPVSNSPLQRFPLFNLGDGLALVLPTAISYAIRAAVIDFALMHNLLNSVQITLNQRYSELFRNVNLLGSFVGAPIYFTTENSLPTAEMTAEADAGVYVHFLFVADTLDHFHESGLAGIDLTPSQHSATIDERINAAIQHATCLPNFRKGVTLVVHCGIGRGVAMTLPKIDHVEWQVHSMSAADLHTLSCTHSFSSLNLWRVIESVDRLEKAGMDVFDTHELLNLIAWVDHNDGHMISHTQVPKEFRGSRSTLQIAPSFVLELRRRAAIENDFQKVPTVQGDSVLVARITSSYFTEDNEQPLYAAQHFSRESGLPTVYLSSHRAWWCNVIPSPTNMSGSYEHYLMLNTWMARIVPVLEPIVDRGLGAVVLVKVEFEARSESHDDGPLPDRADIDKHIRVAVQQDQATVSIIVGNQFKHALAQPTNISERCLVGAICRGLLQLGNVSLSVADMLQLESAIVASDDARHMHAFQARTFREFVHDDLPKDRIQIDNIDLADVRMGLAFRIEAREGGRSSLRSKNQCTKLLNALVRSLEDEVCKELHSFSRQHLIETALLNHEKAKMDRARWSRTARANLALHSDKDATQKVIAEHDMKLSSDVLCSLLLIEFALCECPTDGGQRAGSLDIARLMAKLSAIWQLGGWSDAIHWEAMPAELSITPLGDLHAVTAFQSQVLMPFSERASVTRIDAAISTYDSNFQSPAVLESHQIDIEQEFLDAWYKEFGFSLNDLRKFMDAIEDIGIERKKAIFQIDRPDFEALLQDQYHCANTGSIVTALVLFPRSTWRTVPKGYSVKDIQPWRFRRQLSATRRPLVQIESGPRQSLMIAPGHFRECCGYIIECYYERSFPDRHYKTKAMRKWHDRRIAIRGQSLVDRVAEKLRECGWRTEGTNVEMKSLLARSRDPDFGDLNRYGDVDVLAWHERWNRILVIECKHLNYYKSPGEIAEQLSDYKGKMNRSGKADDLLKHLNRLGVLNARRELLCGKLGLSTDYEIEGWIVFNDPVPMLYSWQAFETRMQIAVFRDIENAMCLRKVTLA